VGRVGASAVVKVLSVAEEAWSLEIMRRDGWFASIMGCTPGSITSEGEALRQSGDPMEMTKKARGGSWTRGMESFLKILQDCRDDGSLYGFEVAKSGEKDRCLCSSQRWILCVSTNSRITVSVVPFPRRHRS